jgi:Tfp pilus assembly protein PilX
MQPSVVRSLARARARRRSGGAAMFVVAVTLGLLAAMGVYGLSATAMDVRAAGHFRESAQAQSAAEHAIMLTAETFTPGTAGEIVRTMQGGTTGASPIQTKTCKTAKPYTGNADYRAAEACLSLSMSELIALNAGVNSWVGTDPTYGTFSPPGSGGAQPNISPSFGAIPDHAFLRVEVTNPVDIPPPPGTGLSPRYTYTQVTATVFIDMKQTLNTTSDTVAQGRGRLSVGPYFK